MANRKPSYRTFEAEKYAWKADIDYREHPEKYQIGRGEQGVLICEPYKSELVKYWKFATPDDATKSSRIIFKIFKRYLADDEERLEGAPRKMNFRRRPAICALG